MKQASSDPQTVVASFSDGSQAKLVAAALRAQGFRLVSQFVKSDNARELSAALREHGLSDADATNVEGRIADRPVLIVEEATVPTLVEDFIIREGGSIESAPTRFGNEPDRKRLSGR